MGEAEPASLEGWVEAINAALGTRFVPEEPGRLFLEFEDGLRLGVDFPEGAESYDIYAPVGYLNAAAGLPRLLAALQLNLYQRGTAGGVIGLDPHAGAFIYSFTFPVDQSSPEVLAGQIEQFVTHARRLRAALEQAAGDVAGGGGELDALAGELAMVREDAAEAYEAAGGDRVEERPSRPPPPEAMIRV